MKDYKYLESSYLLKAVKKRDQALTIVSVFGGVLMSACWVWFILALAS